MISIRNNAQKRELEALYMSRMKIKLNIQNPRTFNEKMQWLKLNYRNYKYVICSDKILAKEYLKKRGYGNYIPQTLAVYQKTENISYNNLPDKFILKTTHGSGYTIICNDKKTFNIKKCNELLEQWMHIKYGKYTHEWFYDILKPRIFVEEYLNNNDNKKLTDYKFMCFNGKCKLIFTVTNRELKQNMNVDFYDINWNKLDFTRLYKKSEKAIPRPDFLQQMLDISEDISRDFPFVRVDFFIVKNKLYLGELTFIPGSGWEPFHPRSYDYFYGNMLVLPDWSECKKQKRLYNKFIAKCIIDRVYWW